MVHTTLMNGCEARITRDTTRLLFGDGSHWFYIEERCSSQCNGPICSRCATKTDTNVQSSRRFKHGLIGEPYPEKTHLFGSPWYIAKLKAYGHPSKESLEKAMQAQKKAHGSIALPSTSPSASPSTSLILPLKKSTRKRTPVSVIVEKEPSTASTASIASSASSTSISSIETSKKIPLMNMAPKISESSDDPLPVRGVSVRSFRPLHVRDIRYWKDSDGNIYECRNNKLGSCIGRWNEDLLEIEDIEPDNV